MEKIFSAHRMGTPGKDFHRPIVIRCSVSLKTKIFQNTFRLAGKPYSVNQQLPEMYAEQKREMRQIKREIEKAEEGKAEQDKSTFLVRNNKLYVNGQLQRKPLTPPAPTDLFANASERENMSKFKFTSAQSKPTKGSQFTAYACVVEKMEDVRMAYKRLFRENPEADHISAAFSAGNCEAYQDDGEFGAGFRLLNIIRSAKLLNVAIFMVQHYGGEHLGPIRFTLIKSTAEEALAKLS